MSTPSLLSSRIDADALTAIAPRLSPRKAKAQQEIIRAFAGPLAPMFAAYGVLTPLRLAHFVAQVAHESDGFATTREYASGAAYEGRRDLGNTAKGDGKRFKGRGLIQLTGRSNYRAFTRWMRAVNKTAPDFEAQPELAAVFPWAAWSPFFYWSKRDLNAVADRDDLVAVTKIVNGGRNGLADRARYLAKAKQVIAALETRQMPAPGGGFAILHRGSQGADVDRLQRILATAGFYGLSIDGDFGPGTEQAVRAFQRSRRLKVDGLVGGKTWVALTKLTTEG